MGILDILQQYANPVGRHRRAATCTSTSTRSRSQSDRRSDLGNGVAAAFRSDATPPFGQMIGDLFGQPSPQQRAGILNQIVQALGSRRALLARRRCARPRPRRRRRRRTRRRRSRPAQASADLARRRRDDRRATPKQQRSARSSTSAGQFYAQHPAAGQGARRRRARDRARSDAQRPALSAPAQRSAAAHQVVADSPRCARCRSPAARPRRDGRGSGGRSAPRAGAERSNVSRRGSKRTMRCCPEVPDPDVVALVDLDRVGLRAVARQRHSASFGRRIVDRHGCRCSTR